MPSQLSPPVSRRRALGMFLSGAGAAQLAPALAVWPRSAMATPATHHTMAVGSATVTVVSDGEITLPLSFVLPDREQKDIEALYAEHGQRFEVLRGEINVTVVKSGAATILIDSGGGTEFMPGMGKFTENLEKAGIAPASVTHVVFTHAHADHLWGVIDPLDDASRFPNARHVMSEVEAAYWTKPGRENDVPDMLRGMTIGIARRMALLGDRIERIKPGIELVPGVALVDTAGHTPGHMSVMVGQGRDQLMIGGDVLTNPIVSFARPDWPWGSDADKDLAISTRRRTLDRLATDRVQLLGYHLPWPGAGLIERNGTAYRFVQG